MEDNKPTIEKIITTMKKNSRKNDIKLISKAYEFAKMMERTSTWCRGPFRIITLSLSTYLNAKPRAKQRRKPLSMIILQ
mgnify:CR=1 FL=1